MHASFNFFTRLHQKCLDHGFAIPFTILCTSKTDQIIYHATGLREFSDIIECFVLLHVFNYYFYVFPNVRNSFRFSSHTYLLEFTPDRKIKILVLQCSRIYSIGMPTKILSTLMYPSDLFGNKDTILHKTTI